MKFIRWALLTLIVAAPIAAADPPKALSAEEQALFAWWDGLGFPDVVHAKFVRAATGMWSQQTDEEPKAFYEHAFLVGDDGSRFRIFTTELRLESHLRTPPGTKEHERVGYEEVDAAAFHSFVEDGTKGMLAVKGPIEWHEHGPDAFVIHRYLVPNQSYRLLVIARACAGRGRPDLAHTLCDLALREQGKPREPASPSSDDSDRFAALKRNLAADFLVALIQELGDTGVTLAEVGEGYRRFAKGFPQHPEAERARKDAETIDAMVAAAAARSKEEAGAAASPSAADRIEDLVFRLREMSGRRWAGWDQTSAGDRAKKPDAQDELIAIGLPAVPRLLAALDDAAFTRIVLEYESGHGQLRDHVAPYRVRDAAVDALDRIASGGFRPEDGSAWSLHSEKEEDRAAIRRRAEAWFAQVKEQGEETYLAKIVASGAGRAGSAARTLVDRYPNTALEPLRLGTAAAKDAWQAAKLVDLMGAVADEKAVAVLLDILRADTRFRVRLSSANALLSRGRRDGVHAMVEQWKHPSPPPMEHVAPDLDLPADPAIGGDLLAFLVESNDAEAFRALGDGLSRRSTSQRFEIVSSFLSGGAMSTMAVGGGIGGGGKGGGRREPDAEGKRVLEDLLGERLSDEDEVEGVSMSIDSASVDDRIGLVAAWALSSQFPDLYRFDPKASAKEKESQRRAAEELWRSRKGLPKLPPPALKHSPAPVPAAVLAPLLDRLLGADSEARPLAGTEIEAKGLGALPALLERIRSLPADHAARHDAEVLSRRLASFVTEVVIDKRSAHPDAGFAALLEASKGKPFDAERFMALVLFVTQKTPEGSTGIRLRAARGDDLSGVTLTVELTRTLAGPNGSGGGWESSGPAISIGGRSGGVSSGSMALDYGQSEGAWKEGAGEIGEAFAASPPDVAVSVRFSVVRERLAGK